MPTPKKIKCVVKKIIDHKMHVYSIFLSSSKRLPKFTPGQFLHLTLDNYDPSKSWPESRIFSIAGTYLDNSELRITYSVKGKYTRRMEQELKPGSEVWIKMPYGDFVIDQDSDVVLLAGGTGITAFMAFIESIDKNFNNSVVLVYGAKTDDLLIFRDRIEAIALANQKLTVNYFIEKRTGISQNPRMTMNSTVTQGIISVDSILPLIKDSKKVKYYLSGPPGMIHSLQNELKTSDIKSEQIFIDAWE